MNRKRSYTVVVAEDEPAAQARLVRLLSADRRWTVVAAVASGSAALAAAEAHRPDAMFLDIQMPGLDGLDVARRVTAPDGPLCVFVTAFDGYALPAFEVHAVDYLLKPFDDQRVARSLAWLAQQLEHRTKRSRDLSARIALRVDGSLAFVHVADISHLTADGYCAHVHTGRRTYHVRESLASLLARLPAGFVRAHRSALVNVDAVDGLESLSHGDACLRLRDGDRIRVSRQCRREVLTALGHQPERGLSHSA